MAGGDLVSFRAVRRTGWCERIDECGGKRSWVLEWGPEGAAREHGVTDGREFLTSNACDDWSKTYRPPE